LREETYRRALAILVNAQQRQPLAVLFGAAGVELGRTALPNRRPGGGRRRSLRAHCFRAFLHAPLGPPGAVPHGRDPAFRRSRSCHRRAATTRPT
jgi:hypothetical protein